MTDGGAGLHTDKAVKQEKEDEPARKIKVTKLPEETTEDSLMNFFENRRRNGGGPVEDIQYYPVTSSAIIEFQEADAVDRVLKKRSFLFLKKQISVEEYVDEVEEVVVEVEEPSICTIEVSGFAENAVEEVLEMYFENTKRSGGGEVTSVVIEDGVALVTFAEEDVASSVCQREHTLDGHMLNVSLHLPKKKSSDMETMKEEAVEPVCTIEVRGYKLGTESTIEMYFENTRRSGGDEIQKFEPVDSDGVVFITFASEEVARRVAERQHQLSDCNLDVKLYEPPKHKSANNLSKIYSNEPQENVPHCTIEVRGVTKTLNRTTLQLYFENTKRSGGDEIVKVEYKEENELAYITYESEEVAQRVVMHGQHKVEGQPLEVKLNIPPPPKPTYTDRVLLAGLTNKVTRDGLTNFLEAKIGLTPQSFLFSEERDKVIITFDEVIDFQILEEACKKRSLEGSHLRPSKVQVSNCILVCNLKITTDEDTIELYFENVNRSWGGPIEKVDFHRDEDFCLVYFKDYTVCDHVLKRKHKIDGSELQASIFYESLGCISEDDNGPSFKIPTPTEMDSGDIKSIVSGSDFYDPEIDLVAKTITGPNLLRAEAVVPATSETLAPTAETKEAEVEQKYWTYPNDKRITLVNSTSCNANVIIVPGKSGTDGQPQFSGKAVVRLKVPDWNDGKAKNDLREKIEEAFKQVSDTTVGIYIKAVEGWRFNIFLKCFLFKIKEFLMKNDAESCPVECVTLLVKDASDYKKAIKIIDDSFKWEGDNSVGIKSQELPPQVQVPLIKRIKVKVQQGQLHAAQADVLVNTVSRMLDLSQGAISASLLSRGGDGIQKELMNLYEGKVKFGEVLKTGAGKLQPPCKAIYHGVLYHFKGHSESVMVFNKFIISCLEEAHKKKYKSIAFPPIGTGNLQYPKDLVASIMFQSVAKFERDHLTSKLEEVMFVIYEKDQETLQIFEDMYRRVFEIMDSVDDIESIFCGSDFYDPEKDLVVKNITGPNLMTDEAVVTATGETVAPATEKSCVLKLLTEESFKNHEETVGVDLMWQRVMVKFGYLENLYNKFPNLIINWDESNNVFMLKGPRNEARTAANTILEILRTAQQEISVVTFSPGCQLEIFTHPEMRDYINSVIPQVDVVWSLNHLSKKIHLFAKDPKQLHAIDKVIKGCVQEKFYPVLKDHAISTQTTSNYLEELKNKYTGRLVIHFSASGLLVTTADDIYENVDVTIQEILSGEGCADQ